MDLETAAKGGEYVGLHNLPGSKAPKYEVYIETAFGYLDAEGSIIYIVVRDT